MRGERVDAVDEALILEQVQIGPMANFTYLIGARRTREVVVVDPAWDIDGLLDHIAERGYILTAALATHYHPDHVGGGWGGHNIAGVAELIGRNRVKVHVHRAEAAGMRKLTGLSESDLVKVDSGDRLRVGDIEVEFLHTPGHTPGSQCFRVGNTLISGDTLFINGCGRVDLPGSDAAQMYHSLQLLKSLPDDTVVLPGHNYGAVPNATLAESKRVNAHLAVKDLASWQQLMG